MADVVVPDWNPSSKAAHLPSDMRCRSHLLQQVVGGLVLITEVPSILLDVRDVTLVLLAALCAGLRCNMLFR